MKWNEVIIITASEAVDATANLFMEVGAGGTVVEDEMDFVLLQNDGLGSIKDEQALPADDRDVLVKAYFSDSELFVDTIQLIKEKMVSLESVGLELGKFELVINDIKEEDWENAWKQYYHPIRLTRFLTVVPFWEEYQPEQADEKVIVMDPGMAFGTGTHPTTRLAVEALELTMRGNEKVLDVGTGSGVLSIAAKALGAADVQAYDLDEVATRQARKNFGLNNLESEITVKENNLLNGIVDEKADIIIANILAEILILMIEDAWNNLKDNGYFILSGIIFSKKEELETALEEQGFVIEQVKSSKDWYCFLCVKNLEDK